MTDTKSPEEVLSRPCKCRHDECDAIFDIDPGMDGFVEVKQFSTTDREVWRFCSLACATAELDEFVDAK